MKRKRTLSQMCQFDLREICGLVPLLLRFFPWGLLTAELPEIDPLVLMMGVFSPEPFALIFLIFDKSNVTVFSRSMGGVLLGIFAPSDCRSVFPLLTSLTVIPSYLSPPFMVGLRRAVGEG